MIIPNTQYLKIDTVKYTHRTRSGHPARILCTDFLCHRPVVAASLQSDGTEALLVLLADLRIDANIDSQSDLFEHSPWEDVAVDTPIWVCNYKGCPPQWVPRHFAKYENGVVFAWMSGMTSHTRDDEQLTKWEHATLENPNEPSFNTTSGSTT